VEAREHKDDYNQDNTALFIMLLRRSLRLGFSFVASASRHSKFAFSTTRGSSGNRIEQRKRAIAVKKNLVKITRMFQHAKRAVVGDTLAGAFDVVEDTYTTEPCAIDLKRGEFYCNVMGKEHHVHPAILHSDYVASIGKGQEDAFIDALEEDVVESIWIEWVKTLTPNTPIHGSVSDAANQFSIDWHSVAERNPFTAFCVFSSFPLGCMVGLDHVIDSGLAFELYIAAQGLCLLSATICTISGVEWLQTRRNKVLNDAIHRLAIELTDDMSPDDRKEVRFIVAGYVEQLYGQIDKASVRHDNCTTTPPKKKPESMNNLRRYGSITTRRHMSRLCNGSENK
jgi:hypothetical protein